MTGGPTSQPGQGKNKQTIPIVTTTRASSKPDATFSDRRFSGCRQNGQWYATLLPPFALAREKVQKIGTKDEPHATNVAHDQAITTRRANPGLA